MTDNEIIKALECCLSSNYEDCLECPLHSNFYPNSCHCKRDKNALALINRQKAEIERLKKELEFSKAFHNEAIAERNLYSHKVSELENKVQEQKSILEAIDDEMFPLPFGTDFDKAIKTAKTEAVKEFAERLKEKVKTDLYHYYKDYAEFSDIDNLVKEMTELLQESQFCMFVHGTECIYGWHESDCKEHAKHWLNSEAEQ